MRILVGTDGSSCAEVALDLVARLAWPAHTQVHLVRAISIGVPTSTGTWPTLAAVDIADIEASLRSQAQAHLDEARERLERPDLTVTTSVRSGRAADVIRTEAARQHCDLVVVGSRGHGTLESMLLGSVSSEVVDHARVPVLVARDRDIGSVVLAYDGSAGAEAGADFLASSGAFTDLRIDVVSVADAASMGWVDMGMSPPTHDGRPDLMAAESSRTEHEELAAMMAERLRDGGLRAKPERRDGDPAEQIVRAAKTHGAGLIVVGTRGRTGLKRLLLGSVARNVLHHAHCSVLIAHAAPARELAA